jgi:transcriptional regulator with GAF, ATPase, and Fis domain
MPESSEARSSVCLLDYLAAWKQGMGCSLDAIEEQLLREAVERSAGNLSAAARLLGMTRAQLAYRLKKRENQDPADYTVVQT